MTATARVLVVEDNEDLRVAVTTELAAHGFRVDEAVDLAAAESAAS